MVRGGVLVIQGLLGLQGILSASHEAAGWPPSLLSGFPQALSESEIGAFQKNRLWLFSCN